MQQFAKYEGLGNDFIIIESPSMTPKAAAQLCDRHRGIGGDGVLLASKENTLWRMVVLNADGSRPEMCGNGLRCFARWLVETERTQEHVFQVLTDAGPRRCQYSPKNIRVELATADFNRNSLPMTGEGKSTETILLSDQKSLRLRGVSIGNPHAVIECPEPNTRQLAERFGAEICNHQLFPNRVNVGFAHIRKDDSVELTVYERGCGITQACGTGAGAAIAVLLQDRPEWLRTAVSVDLPGGRLKVSIEEEKGQLIVWIEGPAEHVFNGEIHSQDTAGLS